MFRKMQRAEYSTFAILVLCLFSVQNVKGMNCEWGGSKTTFDKLNVITPKECPTFIDKKDNMFCCKGKLDIVYCCDAREFFFSNNLEIVLPVLIAIGVGIIIICCVCCFCCPCCLMYKRRHRGAVYGNVPQPAVQTVMIAPQPVQQPYPTQPPQGYSLPPGMHQVYAGQQPTSYSSQQEAYSKQAPYNPSYHS